MSIIIHTIIHYIIIHSQCFCSTVLNWSRRCRNNNKLDLECFNLNVWFASQQNRLLASCMENQLTRYDPTNQNQDLHVFIFICTQAYSQTHSIIPTLFCRRRQKRFHANWFLMVTNQSSSGWWCVFGFAWLRLEGNIAFKNKGLFFSSV